MQSECEAHISMQAHIAMHQVRFHIISTIYFHFTCMVPYIVCSACVCDGTVALRCTMHSTILDLQLLFLFHWRTRYITSIYNHSFLFLSTRCNNGPALTQSMAPQMPIFSFHLPVIAKVNLIVNYARRNECPALYKMSWRGTTHVRLYP
jgi:hypothetical protein